MAAEKKPTDIIQPLDLSNGEAAGQKVLDNQLNSQGAIDPTAQKIGQPGDNIAEVFGIESGKTYLLDFPKGAVLGATLKGGDVVVEFSNGSSVILKGYQAASDVTLQTTDGKTISADELLSYYAASVETPPEDQLNPPANENAPTQTEQAVTFLDEQVNNIQDPVENGIEKLTEMDNPLEVIQKQIAEEQGELSLEEQAEQLAQLETAAGEGPQGGTNGPQNTGQGFGSAFESQGVIELSDVGPIDPTALKYGVDFRADDVFLLNNEEDSLPPLNPEVEVEDAFVYEDDGVVLSIKAEPENVNGKLTITLSGFPEGWRVEGGGGTYDSQTGTWTITLEPGESYDGGPKVYPPHDSDVDLPGLKLEVTEVDLTTGQTGKTTTSVNIIVDAVADEPDVDGLDKTGPEGTPLNVDITGQAGDTDGSEVIVKYQISGVPQGFSFNQGTEVSPGLWEFTPGQITGLQAIPPNDDYHGSINLVVTIFTTEDPVTDREFDLTNNDETASDEFTLTWIPICDPPEVFVDLPKDPDTGVKTAEVYEDNSVAVGVTGTLAPGGTPNEVLTLTVTGIDMTKLDNLVLEGEAGAVWTRVVGSPDNNASFTITLPANTNYAGLFTFTPKAQSDLDLTSIKVSGSAYEPASDTTANANQETFDVIVDAVADKPSIVAEDGEGEEGAAIPVDISGQLGVDNFDASESITGYQIKGNMAGFTFEDALGNPVGTKISDTQWNFTPAEIVGLHIVPPTANYSGSLDLTAVVLTVDNPGDRDFDDTNNTNFAEDAFCVIWDDIPHVTNATETVDETNIVITETGSVTVDYGNDGPGTLTGTNTFASSGSLMNNALTSNGVMINVSYANGLYTGTAGNTTVFTLRVNTNGTYEYKQFEQLDHADANDDNDIITLTFGVRATDSDSDAANGTITINVKDDAPDANNDKFCVEESTDVVVSVNNGGDTIWIKEDGQGSVPVHASYTGGDGDEAMTLLLTGVPSNWTLTAPGWTKVGNDYTITLPAGQKTFNGNLTFKPPANSDVDAAGLKVKVSLSDPDTATVKTSEDGFTLQVDAVADVPTLSVPNTGSYSWYVYDDHTVALNIASSVTDTDGSEAITKIVIYLNNAFSTNIPGIDSFADMGAYLNKGTEISHGVWEIPVNAGNTQAALNGLAMIVPWDGSVHGDNWGNIQLHNYYWNGKGHNASISVETHAEEVNLSGGEWDTTDNKVVVSKTFEICFKLTPLVLDLDGDGVEIIAMGDTPLFDMNNNGTLDRTSWVSGDDGLLAIDTNNDGVINNQSELFGDSISFADGFANLSSYDLNSDGVINATDAAFADLIVWRDINQDGVSQDGEMFSLDDLGIASISLNAANSNQTVADADIIKTATYTTTGGVTRTIADVSFTVGEGAAQEGLTIIQQNTATPPGNTNQTPAQALSDRVATGNVLANDSVGQDTNGSVTSITFGNQTYQIPAGGQIAINGTYGFLVIASTGAFTFTAFAADGAQDVEDVFTYTMRDFDGDTDTATLTLCVEQDAPAPVDDRPDAINDNGGTVNAINQVKTGNVMTNDDKGDDLPTIVTAVDGQAVGVNGLTINGTYGTLVIQQNGTYTYTSTTHGMGVEDFTYTITDVDGDSDSAVLDFNLNCPAPVDDRPDAINDNGGTVNAINQVKTGNVMTNDDKGDDLPTIVTAVDGQTVGVNGLTINGTYGTLVIQQNGTYTYTSTSHGMGVEDFTYTITDVDGDSDSAVLNFNLNCPAPVDDRPDAINDNGGTVTAINQVKTGNVMTNDDKGDDLPTIVTAVNGQNVGVNGLSINGTYGTLVIQQNGSYTYTSTTHGVGVENFTYTITDVDGDSDSAILCFTITCPAPVDDQPDAVNDNGGTINAINQVKTGNVMTNDDKGDDLPTKVTAVDGQTVGVNGLTINGTYGTLVIQQDGSYTYTSTTHGIGIEDFTYTITDVDGDSDSAVLNFNLNCPAPVDDRPVVTNATELVDETGLVITETGSVTVGYGNDGPGTVAGNNIFTSSGSQLGGTLKSGGVAVAVTFTGGLYTGKAGATTVFTLQVNANGTYEYKQFKPLDHADMFDANDIITLNFGVTATDADGDTGTGTIVVNVKDDAPTARNDGAYNVQEDASVTGNVTANDTFSKDVPNKVVAVFEGDAGYIVPDGGSVSIPGLRGTLVMHSDGSYTYTANGVSNNGHDIFTYQLVDSDGDKSSATIDFNVTPAPDDKPVVTNATELVDETGLVITETGTVTVGYGGDGPGTVAVNGTFASEGSRLNGALTSGGVAVTVGIAAVVGYSLYEGYAGATKVFSMKVFANGTYEYKQFEPLDHADPTNPNDVITLNFGVTATDADGDTGTGKIVINVKDDSPSAQNDNGGTLTGMNDTATGNVLNNDTDSKDEPTVVYKVNGKPISNAGTVIDGTYGKLTIKADGSYSYQVTKFGEGIETFTYKIDDFDKDQATATLTFNVSNCAPPIILNDNFATIWGDFSYIQYSLLANDGPNGNGTGLPAGTRVYGFVYNGQTYNVANGSSKSVNIPNGSVQFWSDGTVRFNKTNPNGAVRFDDFTVLVIDNAGNTATQHFSASQLQDGNTAANAALINGSDARDVVFGESGSDVINGGANHDYLFGEGSQSTSGSADTIRGGAGDDLVQGHYGNDTLYGDAGNDIIFGDATDTIGLGNVVYEGNGNIVANTGAAATGSYAGNDSLYGGDGNDYMFGGNGNDMLDGGTGEDHLRGGNGTDTMYGGAGSDVLDGMAGNDVLYGGSDADLFLFGAITDGVDTIKDFNLAEGDQLGFADLLNGYDPLQDMLDDFVFVRSSGANTIVSVNASGNGNAAQAIDIAVLENRTLSIQDLDNHNGIVA